MFSGIKEQATWSDAFFNFEPAMIAFNAVNPDIDVDDLSKAGNPQLYGAAMLFLLQYPNCPADGEWLVGEFLKRV